MMVSMAGAMSVAEIGKIFLKLFAKIKYTLFQQEQILKKTLWT
jgi:hypothetical protein